ncbi:hypothetical protein HR45_06720 [Shewanella mangrovi]|uniref:Flagellar hook-length control protein-like C-terminal domain-containing protein n=2 Tax=Shewanella mangrovi TaxID=1515746 RepID=A0A094JG21_9GAMM|nr:hypothetical protein HR45_06720 [Shewanella mangrovi]
MNVLNVAASTGTSGGNSKISRSHDVLSEDAAAVTPFASQALADSNAQDDEHAEILAPLTAAATQSAPDNHAERQQATAEQTPATLPASLGASLFILPPQLQMKAEAVPSAEFTPVPASTDTDANALAVTFTSGAKVAAAATETSLSGSAVSPTVDDIIVAHALATTTRLAPANATAPFNAGSPIQAAAAEAVVSLSQPAVQVALSNVANSVQSNTAVPLATPNDIAQTAADNADISAQISAPSSAPNSNRNLTQWWNNSASTVNQGANAVDVGSTTTSNRVGGLAQQLTASLAVQPQLNGQHTTDGNSARVETSLTPMTAHLGPFSDNATSAAGTINRQQLQLDAGIGQQITNLLKDRVQLQLEHGQQTAQIRLDPPRLGSIDVRISIEGDRTVVHLNASHAAIRDAIANTTEQLRTALAGKLGSDVTVFTNADSGGQSQQHQAPQSAEQIDSNLLAIGEDPSVPPTQTQRGWINRLA